jgi:hypothetical protein
MFHTFNCTNFTAILWAKFPGFLERRLNHLTKLTRNRGKKDAKWNSIKNLVLLTKREYNCDRCNHKCYKCLKFFSVCVSVDPLHKCSPETRKLMFPQHQRDAGSLTEQRRPYSFAEELDKGMNHLLWLTKAVFQCPTYGFPCIFGLQARLCNSNPLRASNFHVLCGTRLALAVQYVSRPEGLNL